MVAVILRNAVEGGASDIHIEPEKSQVRVRFRFLGELHPSLVLPGDVKQASLFEFPAATTVVTPECIKLVTAESNAGLVDLDPKDKLATAGPLFCEMIQSIPAIIPEVLPEPLQFRTRTDFSMTFFATP